MEWISVKDRFPELGEFVEVIYPDKLGLSDIHRGFAAYWKDDDGYFWTTPGMDEREWSSKGFGIKYWKPIQADPKGRKPYIKTDKRGYFKIYFKHVQD